MADTQNEIDAVTGRATTGHEWDGVRELNTPLPRWWLWLFYITILWSVGYWIVYPTWPLVSSYSRGMLAWSSREAVVEDLAELKVQRGPLMEKLAGASLAEIAADASLSDFARAVGKPAFAENCAPCHGTGGGGAKGYPSLVDDEWLWGGKLSDIEQTIKFGIRSSDDKTRISVMPAFGRDGMLKNDDVLAVTDYVRVLAKLSATPGADNARGQRLYADNCAACHGASGKGNRELGAPDLTDAIWLYGSSRNAIAATIADGRGGVMPAWVGRLDATTIKALAIYVHGFGGGEK